jgi:hypothetical protein
MTRLTNGAVATDIDAIAEIEAPTARGYTIRHIETWHAQDTTCIVWDAPALTETDLPY